MSRFLDPTGQPTYGIGLCARCSRKFFLSDLVDDPNLPNLKVCREDADDYDPYRLAPRPADPLTLPFNRPDTDISTAPSGVISEPGVEFIVSEDGTQFLFVFD